VPTALYRLLGDEDALVYVGIAKAFGKRWQQHAHSQPWWNEVRRQTIDWYPDRDSAKAAEEAAIKAEHPKHNKQHNLGDSPRRPIQRSPWLQGNDRLLGEAVRGLRMERGMSQAIVARLMHAQGWPWHQTTVARLEHGGRVLEFFEALDLAAILGTSHSELAAMAWGDRFSVELAAA
jgi:predicted GIY-YIG superfamily endonuclease